MNFNKKLYLLLVCNHDPPDFLNALQSVARLNPFFTCSERLGRQRLKQARQFRVRASSKIAKIAKIDDFPAKPDFPRFPRRFLAKSCAFRAFGANCGMSDFPKTHFSSDNTAGICPEAWDALSRANADYVPSYGNDFWTGRAADLIRELFETDCDVYFVFNGTAANSLALASCCQSYHSVICHEHAHIEQDECGAPEFFSNGTKLLGLPGAAGKISATDVLRAATKRKDIHYPKPRVLSLTQSTECGTLYTLCELHELNEAAQQAKLVTQMDGARLGQAMAALCVAPKEITWQAGVDVLCFGGTKAGLATTEAVIFFRRELSEEFAYRCKQAGQLASKMRFLSAGWVGLLENGAWLRHAQNANARAHELSRRLVQEAQLSLAYPTEANAVFVQIPPALAAGLRARGWVFYEFIGGAARLMCSWKTTSADIDAFLQDVVAEQTLTKRTS